MKFGLDDKDVLMQWLAGLVTFLFLMGGVFDILDLAIVKLVLFSGFLFLAINIYLYLFKDENKKSPDDDIE